MKRSDVIKLALEEVGYLGKKSNAKLYEKTANTSGKYTKYAQELYEAGYYNATKVFNRHISAGSRPASHIYYALYQANAS